MQRRSSETKKLATMDSKFLVRASLSLVFILAVLKEAKGTEFNVKNFGAKADGKSDDSRVNTSTHALQLIN